MDKLLVVFIAGFACGAVAMIALIVSAAVTIDKAENNSWPQ